jgi:hypothetical protein
MIRVRKSEEKVLAQSHDARNIQHHACETARKKRESKVIFLFNLRSTQFIFMRSVPEALKANFPLARRL